MKAIFTFYLILPIFALFALTDSQINGSKTRLLNIYRDKNNKGYYGQNRTLIPRSRATQSKTATNYNSTSTTSDQTILKPTTTKATLLFAIYEKPAWTLAQIQQLYYYKNNATRHNATTYKTSTVNATKHIRSSTNNTEHAKLIEIRTKETTTETPTTTTTTYTTNTALHVTDETTHETPKYNEAQTLPTLAGQNELYHFSETTSKPTTQKGLYRPIYFGKVNKKTTVKKQGRRTRRRYARPAYNTSKLLAFL